MLNTLRKPAALFAILMIGFALRCYNLTFPSIGYHNMKENEYLSIAQEMMRTGDLFHAKIYYYDAFEAPSGDKGHTQSSIMPYQIMATWSLLGENLWGPRMVNVVFGVLALAALYGISILLFSDVRFALTSTFIAAILPISLFFSRYIMPDSPALFFMLLGSMFYVRYALRRKNYDLFIGSSVLSLALFYKPSFLIGAVPFLFLIPYREILKGGRKALLPAALALGPYAAAVSLAVWMQNSGFWELARIDPKRLLEVFNLSYWAKNGRTLWWFAYGENFTLAFSLMAAVGGAIALVRVRGVLNRYLIGWIFAAICYAVLYPDEIAQINYFQMPFVAFVSISSAYAIYWVSGIIKRAVKKDIALLLIFFLIGDSVYFVYNAMGRMNNTAFIGVDAAGETLRELTRQEERVFLLTHAQGYGIARYAHRYVGWASNLNDLKGKETKFSIRYLCVYPADFIRMMQSKDPAMYDYISRNYTVKEVGMTQEPHNVYYLILEKGEASDPKVFLESLSGQARVKTIYRISGNYVFFYVIRPSSQEPKASQAK